MCAFFCPLPSFFWCENIVNVFYFQLAMELSEGKGVVRTCVPSLGLTFGVGSYQANIQNKTFKFQNEEKRLSQTTYVAM